METVREFECTKAGRSDRSIFHLKESSIMANQLNLPRVGRFGALPSIKSRGAARKKPPRARLSSSEKVDEKPRPVYARAPI